jgi:NADH dehydrogenase
MNGYRRERQRIDELLIEKSKEASMFLVIGATGYLGSMIACNLLTAGHSVRTLVREGSKTLPLEKAGAQVVIGDLQDPSSLMAACQGVTTIISTANTRAQDYDENTQATDVRGYQNLIRAAQAAGTDHFLYVSALGADPYSPIPYLAAKGQTEADLRASGMVYTIFRPSYFMDFWFMGLVFGPATQGQPVWVWGDGSDCHWPVAAKDVAEYVVKGAIDHPSARNQVIAILGPQPLSLREAALVAERILGKSICIKTLDPSAPPPDLSPLTIQLMSLGSTLELSGERMAAKEFRVKLTTLDDYLNGILANPAKA